MIYSSVFAFRRTRVEMAHSPLNVRLKRIARNALCFGMACANFDNIALFDILVLVVSITIISTTTAAATARMNDVCFFSLKKNMRKNR